MTSGNKKQSIAVSPRLLLIVLPFLLLAPVWLTGKALYWGTPSTQFIPWWWQAWLSISHGEVPLWNPMVGMGAPLLANYQSALFYPPTWLYFVGAAIGGLQAMAWLQAILLAAHLAWAGWGMARLASRFGLSELAQTVAGLAFGLSGYLVARAHFLSINAAVAWLPWILLAVYDLCKEPTKKVHAAKLALFFGSQLLTGHAQLAWYTLLLTVAWSIFWSWRFGGSARLKAFLPRFVLAGLIAFALASVQLLPTAEYLLNSQRATEVGFADAATYSFWPWRLLGLLAPNLFGNPAHGNYWGYGNFWEDAIYVGLIPLGLAVFAALKVVREPKHRSLVWFLCGISFVSLLLALGKNLPLFEWLYGNVPSFALFQSPTRFTIWFVFALSLLAGFGVDRWKAPAGRTMYWSRLAIAGAAAVLGVSLIAAALNLAGSISLQPTLALACVSMGIVLLGATILNLTRPRGAITLHWRNLLLLLVSVDLLYAGWGLNPGVSLDFYAERTSQFALAAERAYIFDVDERALKFETLFRFDTFFSSPPSLIRESRLPNTASLDGVASANNFDPLVPARYKDWIDRLETAPEATQDLMLERMAVGLFYRDGVWVETVAAQRARWVACGATVANPVDASDYVRSEAFEIDSIVVEDIDGGAIAHCSAEANTDSPVNLARSSANSVLIDLDAREGGWLLQADNWYPGWKAFADGRELTIYPADGLFRAVSVPPGTSHLEFVYYPVSFAAGLALSLLGLLALAWLSKRGSG